jgi:Xaa-Pro aminopeptidase
VGTLVVTASFAGLWVDSRYWVQAETELADSGIEMRKWVAGQLNAHVDWLAAHLPSGSTLAIDGNVLALGAAAAIQAQMDARGIIVRTDIDVVERVWSDQPALPDAAIFEHAAPFAPHPRTEKLNKVRGGMAAVSADWHLVSTLDDIAWIFNLRGADVSYNPVFVAHALIGPERATLFVDAQKLPFALIDALRDDVCHRACRVGCPPRGRAVAGGPPAHDVWPGASGRAARYAGRSGEPIDTRESAQDGRRSRACSIDNGA